MCFYYWIILDFINLRLKSVRSVVFVKTTTKTTRKNNMKSFWQSIYHVNEHLLMFSFGATDETCTINAATYIILTSNTLINSKISLNETGLCESKVGDFKRRGPSVGTDSPSVRLRFLSKTLISRTFITEFLARPRTQAYISLALQKIY